MEMSTHKPVYNLSIAREKSSFTQFKEGLLSEHVIHWYLAVKREGPNRPPVATLCHDPGYVLTADDEFVFCSRRKKSTEVGVLAMYRQRLQCGLYALFPGHFMKAYTSTSTLAL